MEKYTLSQAESSVYHQDSERVLIRANISKMFPAGVMVVDENDNLLDTLQPHTEVEPAVLLTDEEREEREQLRLIEAREIDHLENEIRPKVIAKITSEVRREFREQLKDKTNEVLESRAKLAKIERETLTSLNKTRTELVLTRAELDRIKPAYTKALSDLSASEEKLTQKVTKILDLEQKIFELNTEIQNKNSRIAELEEKLTNPEST